MFKHWKSDIQAVLDRDPAARSALEVILCYPGFWAVRGGTGARTGCGSTT